MVYPNRDNVGLSYPLAELQTAMLSVGCRPPLVGVLTVAILLSSTIMLSSSLLPSQQSAFATFPGQNGKIASERDDEIWVMNPDGSSQTDLNADGDLPDWSPDGTKIAFGRGGTAIVIINAADGSEERVLDPGDANFHPSWSPDGTKIAFVKEVDPCDWQIWVMNADGSGIPRQLTNFPANCLAALPDWSPDGTKIALGGGNIYVMNAADGSGLRQLTNNGGAPSWSPDGTKIAFTRETQRENQIWVINAADGSGEEQLTTNGGTSPNWSPDGTKIAFGSFRDGNNEIYVMDADGSGERRLTNNPANDIGPDWGTARPTPPPPTATICEGETATIVGTPGNDNNIVGTSGRDVIAALGGNDRISALAGNDLVCGGGGHDRIDGGAGDDRLFGHSGIDNIVGGTGNDFIDGGAGDDYLNGYSDNDILRGSGGDDVLLGSTGNDRLFGMDNNDNLDGGTGTDSGNGGANFDTCVRLNTEINCEA